MGPPAAEFDLRSFLAGLGLPLLVWCSVQFSKGLLAARRARLRADATPYPHGLKVWMGAGMEGQCCPGSAAVAAAARLVTIDRIAATQAH